MTKLAVVVNDIQAPFHDELSVDAVLEFIKDAKPNALVLNGDTGDFYEVSDFDKDPERATNLKSEIDITRDVAHRFAEAAGKKAAKFWNDGNHEDRLRRFLWKHPEISGLDVLTIPNLLDLPRWGYQYHPYGEGFWLNPAFFVVHGNVIRSHSSFTARAMFDKYLCSGISGHTHRLGSYYKVAQTSSGPRVYGWWENGCLCSVPLEYDEHPQWQQGFSLVYYEDDGRFQVVPVPVIDHKFIVPGYGVYGG